MKINALLMLLWLPISVLADEIELSNLFIVTSNMNMGKLAQKLESLPNNSYVDWKSGNYNFDTIKFNNKHNIKFSMEDDVIITSNHISFKDSYNIHFAKFKHINNNSTRSITIQNSEAIAIVNGHLESKDSKGGGILVQNSSDVLLLDLDFKNMNKIKHLFIEGSSGVEIKKCSFHKTQGEYVSIYSANSDVAIKNSTFETQNNLAIATTHSKGVIADNKFDGSTNKDESTNKEEGRAISAILIDKESRFTIKDNTIDNYPLGINVEVSARARIEDNKIKNIDTGVLIRKKSQAIVSGNIITDVNNDSYTTKPGYYGISIQEDSQAMVLNNKIENANIGIRVMNSSAKVSENTINEIVDKSFKPAKDIAFFQDDKSSKIFVSIEKNRLNDVDEEDHYYSDENTIVAIIDNDDMMYEEYFKGGISRTADIAQLDLDIDYTPIKTDRVDALRDADVDYDLVTIINDTLISGLLTEDLVIKNSVIDAEQYVKIDTKSKKIWFPKEYRGMYVDNFLPKLESTNKPIEIQPLIKMPFKKQGLMKKLELIVKTKDTIKSIKYSGNSLIFKKTSDMKTGQDSYSFLISIKNTDKIRSLLLTTKDGRDIIKQFTLNKNVFQLADNPRSLTLSNNSESIASAL